MKLRSLIIDFASGNGFPLWSWEFGFGDDTFGTLSYLIFDPVAWIVVFFPVEAVDVCYSAMCLIKMYLAGLVMFLFLTKSRHLSSQTSTAFALMYAFSFWAIVSLNHVMFPNSLVLLPLLIMGIDKVDGGESPVLLIITTVFAILNYLYFAYMLAIGCLVYVLIKSITIFKNKGFTFKLKRYLKISSLVVISLLISLPFFITIANSFLSTNTGTGVDKEIFPTLNYVLIFLPQLCTQQYDVGSSYDNVGVFGIAFALIPLVFLNLRKNLDGKCFVLFLIIDLFPIGQSIMNGGSYPSSRFSFLIVFFCLVACAIECDKNLDSISMRKKQIKIFILLTVFSAILCEAFGIGGLANLAFLVVNIAFSIVFLLSKKKADDIVKLSFLNVVMIVLLLFTPAKFSFFNGRADVGTAYNVHQASSLNNISGIDDRGLFRTDTLNSSRKEGDLSGQSFGKGTSSEFTGVPTISSYNSITDNRLHCLYSSLEINKGTSMRACLGGDDNRPGIDYLLGVKYFTYYKNNDKYKTLTPNSNFKKTNIDGVMKSKIAPSIGYVLQDSCSEDDFNKLSSVEKEQQLLKSAITKQGNEKYKSETNGNLANRINIDIIGENYSSENNINKVTADSNNKQLTIGLKDKCENEDVYLCFKNIERKKSSKKLSQLWKKEYQNFSIGIKFAGVNKNIANNDGSAFAWSGSTNNYTVYLGQHKEGEDEIKLTFNTLGEYTWDDIEVIAVPKDAMADDMKKLEQTRLKDVKKTKNRIKGNITSENGGILFLSIPYNPGWQVYIDGERQETFICDIAFTGVNITPGDHKVELKYRPIGMPYTFIASAIGILILICICICISRKNKKRGEGVDEVCKS